MDIQGVTANSSDMGTKNICMLIVLDDFTSHNFVCDMLHNQTHQGMYIFLGIVIFVQHKVINFELFLSFFLFYYQFYMLEKQWIL